MDTIRKHQCSALKTKLLGLTLKYSIFIPFSITKIITLLTTFGCPKFLNLNDIFKSIFLGDSCKQNHLNVYIIYFSVTVFDSLKEIQRIVMFY